MTGTSGPARTGRPRSSAAEDAILRATLDVVVEHGIRDTSVDEIAARAHAGKDTIYRRWSHKDQLIRAALEHALEAEVVIAGRGDVADDLARYLEALDRVVLAGTTGTILRELVAEAPRDPAVALRLAAFRERHVSAIARILASGPPSLTTSVEAVAELALGWTVGRRLLGDGSDPPPLTTDLRAVAEDLLATLGSVSPQGPRPAAPGPPKPVSRRRHPRSD